MSGDTKNAIGSIRNDFKGKGASRATRAETNSGNQGRKNQTVEGGIRHSGAKKEGPARANQKRPAHRYKVGGHDLTRRKK